MRKDCDTCKHDEFCSMDEYCKDCMAGNPPTNWQPSDYYEPDTNAEHIRRMTDEELAKFLAKAELETVKAVLDSAHIPCTEEDGTREAVQKEILEWLQMPADE